MTTIAAQPIRSAPQLSENMTKRDLLDVLEHLRWVGRDHTCLVRLDRGVRDYLVRALRQQH